MNLVDFFGLVASITSFVGLLPQIYKTYRIKSAQEISSLMLYNYLVCSLAWVLYGACTSTYFVLYSNILGLISCGVSIFQKRYYSAA